MDKLLIVEDDVEFAQSLKTALAAHGWTVDVAHTGADGLQFLSNFKFDFILLDWELPDTTGLEICKRFRSGNGIVPIIFVTGHDGIEDKEQGLDAGGDDYITKPFDVRELMARIRSIQRRPRTIQREQLSCKQGVSLDPQLRVATGAAKSVQLSLTESNILEFFLRNRNRFFSAAQVFEELWPSDTDSGVGTVKTSMGLLRRKLKQLDAEQLISTVPGSGYILRDE